MLDHVTLRRMLLDAIKADAPRDLVQALDYLEDAFTAAVDPDDMTMARANAENVLAAHGHRKDIDHDAEERAFRRKGRDEWETDERRKYEADS